MSGGNTADVVCTYVATDRDGTEWIYNEKPVKGRNTHFTADMMEIKLPVGSIERLIGRKLSFEDGAVRIPLYGV